MKSGKKYLENIKISPAECLKQAIKERWLDYHLKLKKCKKTFNETNVHQLRVATRRFIAAITTLSSMASAKPLSRIRKRLKKRLNQFGRLRDIHVMQEKIGEMGPSYGNYNIFMETIRKEEALILKSLRKRVRNWRNERIRILVKKILASDTVYENCSFSLQKTMTKYYNKILMRIKEAHSYSPHLIHRIRIALKKFRYKVEILHPFLKKPTEKDLAVMQSLQRIMGEIQDLTVLIDNLHLAKEPCTEIEKRRLLRIKEFKKKIGTIRRFKPEFVRIR